MKEYMEELRGFGQVVYVECVGAWIIETNKICIIMHIVPEVMGVACYINFLVEMATLTASMTTRSSPSTESEMPTPVAVTSSSKFYLRILSRTCSYCEMVAIYSSSKRLFG